MNPSLLALTADDFVSAAMPIGILLTVATLVILGMIFKQQRRRMWHETARLALEKGQPLPPAEDARGERQHNDLRAGLVLIAIGLAFGFTLSGDKSVLAAVPGFVGIALLVNAAIDKFFQRRNS